MKKVLIVCGSGGHAAQALILYNGLREQFDCSFLLEKSDLLMAKKIPDAPIYWATVFRGKHEPEFFMFFRMIACTIESFFVIIKAWPTAIISTGPGVGGPISIWGRIFFRKVIFIESWSRVTTKSRPGKILYYIANRFYVQWPEEKKNYPKARYAGRLG